ncbi:glycoside hydrolase family 1 protein [Fusibacter ferrireducens]|uniref:Glycoside hydrolase family 1 protein n=1 Tax=Fusibacter ferrireducens TaxID=2785058 RepID=A0ABR9ZMC0_9FIRM|nr:glycoside hydrolase family 1 protein [Fusibacter ferrireducens]MBF4691617.1 glycoside hydrolase family 1 protein [Fusibacter ferrireducens]
MKPFNLPSTFKLGSATAATQIEGGDLNSNWYHWGLQGRIANQESSIVAADHYNRYREDIDLMKQLHQEVYRMSIEWSRIEPEEGIWSEEGIKHYRQELTLLIEAGIEPLVTLHHFSQPQWFEAIGAWTHDKCVFYFTRFVKKVIESIGDLVNEYCTINEPNVLVNDSYMDGNFPPGKKGDMKAYFKASKHLILAHLESYQLIHKMRTEMGYSDTMVGMVHHLAYFESAKKDPFTKMSRNILDYAFHTLFLKGMVEGQLAFPIGHGYPHGKGIFCDFIGINYYSRHMIHFKFNPGMLFGEIKFKAGLTDESLNDMGWEIYPKGLYEVVEKVYRKYALPIYITENGIPDSQDQKRTKFIITHLEQVHFLIEAGVDIRRYYYWSLLDNLEWHDGYGPRFGLIEVNYKTLERSIRSSGKVYAQICQTKKIGANLIEQYIDTSSDAGALR